jgi:hypothetical protein
MPKSLHLKKLIILLLAGALAAACGAPAPRIGSRYFVVVFLPGTPAPGQEGVEALGNAVKQAARAAPRAIAIQAVEPSGGAEPVLEQARAQTIIDAFVRAGVDAHLITTDLVHATDKGYAERKDGFEIQLRYGEAPRP